MPLKPEERYTEAEKYQRRVDTLEWKPNVMTEDERLERRRVDAGIAFEMMPQTRWDHFNKGATDHLPKES